MRIREMPVCRCVCVCVRVRWASHLDLGKLLRTAIRYAFEAMRPRPTEGGSKCVNGKTLSTLNLSAGANFGIHDTCNTTHASTSSADISEMEEKETHARPRVRISRDAPSPPLSDNIITDARTPDRTCARWLFAVTHMNCVHAHAQAHICVCIR